MMNNQPTKPAGNHGQEIDFKAVLLHLWKVCVHQWPWKLACVVIAVFLWGVLIAQDDSLTRERTFEDVEITVANATTLQRNGFIVVSGLENLEGLDITAQIPQKYYNAANPSAYNVRVDLSKIQSAGQQTLPIEHTRHALYGTLTDYSIREITVTVEEYMTRSRIPVKVQVIGDMPEGLYGNASNITVDPEYITVSGPRSVVASIVRCVARYDLSSLSGNAGHERTACAFVLENSSGQQVDTSLLTFMVNGVSVDSIVVEQNVYPTVSQNLSTLNLIKGEVAEGYYVKTVTVMPQNIVVAVRDASSFVSDLAYLEGAVDVTGLTQSTTAVLPISRPSDVINMNTDVAYVTVEIEKIQDAEGTT